MQHTAHWSTRRSKSSPSKLISRTKTAPSNRKSFTKLLILNLWSAWERTYRSLSTSIILEGRHAQIRQQKRLNSRGVVANAPSSHRFPPINSLTVPERELAKKTRYQERGKQRNYLLKIINCQERRSLKGPSTGIITRAMSQYLWQIYRLGRIRKRLGLSSMAPTTSWRLSISSV